jgi:tetracycline resistance efflux pump
MLNSWIVMLPPLLVLFIAILSHNVLLSLLSGIVIACVLVTQLDPLQAIYYAAKNILQETQLLNLWAQNGEYDHLYTLGFLTILGILVQLMTHTGGIQACTRLIRSWLNNKRSAEKSSLLLSCFFFLDDYLNNLATGSIMQPITDLFSIPRAKLAYLIDSMSGALCLLIPASSWIAFSIMQLQSSGVSPETAGKSLILIDPLTMYIKTMPYLLYPWAITFSAWWVAQKGISFGTMYQHEREAETTGNLFGGKTPLTRDSHTENVAKSSSLRSFILPLGTFLGAIPFMARWIATWSSFQHLKLSWPGALQHADVILQSLFFSSLFALVVSSIYLLYKREISLFLLSRTSWSGVLLMKNSLMVLLLAWTLGSLLKNDLHTGEYIARTVIDAVPLAILPVALFITSTLITASTGSSWGTLTILLPITVPLFAALAHEATPLLPEAIPLLFPLLGALFSGTVSGGHFSPITDTTVMASSSAGCYHIDHVKTQMAYSIPALISSMLGFVLLAVLPSTITSLIAVLVIVLCMTAGILLIRNQRA